MKSYQKRSRVLTIANALVKQGWSFSAAQKRGWEVVRFQETIQKGEAIIRFFKEGKDIPEQRIATSINSTNYVSKNTDKKRNPLQVSYFELNSNQIKSFNVTRFDSFRAVA